MSVRKDILFPVREKNVRGGTGVVHPYLEPFPHLLNFVGRGHGRRPPSQPASQSNFSDDSLGSEERSHRHDACEVALITTGIKQGSESTNEIPGQPDGPVSSPGGRQKHIAMQLVEYRSVGVIAVVGIHQQYIDRPLVSPYQIHESPVFKILSFITDAR